MWKTMLLDDSRMYAGTH